MATEYEWKFRVTPEIMETLQAAFPGEEIAMETTYYDTPSGSLSRRKLALRLRRENGKTVCTCKSPLPDGSRGEWETPCMDIHQGVALLISLGCPQELEELAEEGLVPVCGARFRRLATTIDYQDARLEVALDKGVLVGGGKELPLLEAEVELKSGSREAADSFARELADKYGLVPEEKSKFQRALALAREGCFRQLFQKYDRLVIFDTETTGLDGARDEIIEFSAVVLEEREGQCQVVQTYDQLITLSPGSTIPEKIQQLTGITPQDIRERGVPKTRVCRDIAQMIGGNTLLLAYNAAFDLIFLYYMLLRDGDAAILQGKDKLDLLTVYRDRRSYPHRLCNAIESYGLQGQVVNSHRAIDDVLATVEVMKAMEREKDDLISYVNIFGYLAKYGCDRKKIRSVRYRPQGFEPGTPVYQKEEAYV